MDSLEMLHPVHTYRSDYKNAVQQYLRVRKDYVRLNSQIKVKDHPRGASSHDHSTTHATLYSMRNTGEMLIENTLAVLRKHLPLTGHISETGSKLPELPPWSDLRAFRSYQDG